MAAHCGGDIYSRRKPLFSSFGEHTAVCGSSVRQAVARPRHRQSVCIHNIHVAATCRPSVLGSATMRGHLWLNKVASVLGPLFIVFFFSLSQDLEDIERDMREEKQELSERVNRLLDENRKLSTCLARSSDNTPSLTDEESEYLKGSQLLERTTKNMTM